MSLSKELNSIINKCNFYFENQLISKEEIVKKYWYFLSMQTENSAHDTLGVLHNGSIIFDAINILFSAFSAILNNPVTNHDIITTLNVGDIVIYHDSPESGGKGKKYEFGGIETQMNAKTGREYKVAVLLKDHGKGLDKIPQSKWEQIKPYRGKSQTLKSQGVKREKGLKNKFFKHALGKECPVSIGASVVVITNRSYYERLFDGCSIKFGSERIQLSELVTAAYYTDNNRLDHSGNSIGADPVLKFTSNIEQGRKLSRGSEDNFVQGVTVLGNSITQNNVDDIQKILNRKKIPFVLISSRLDHDAAIELCKLSESKVHWFACTKEMLEKLSTESVKSNAYTDELYGLSANIVNRKVHKIIVDKLTEDKTISRLYQLLLKLKRSDYTGNEKEDFLLESYGLLNLFNYAPFSMGRIEQMVQQGMLAVNTPEGRICNLAKLLAAMPGYMQKDCADIISIFSELNDRLNAVNPKEIKLIEILAGYKNKTVAVIVKAAYYNSVLANMGLASVGHAISNIIVTTPTKFDYSRSYDAVITVGYLQSNVFNPIDCISSRDHYVILYPHELSIFNSKLKSSLKLRNVYHNTSEKFESDEIPAYSEWKSEYIDPLSLDANIVSDMNELDEAIFNISQSTDVNRYIRLSSGTSRTSEISAIAILDNFDRVFFSKMYKAYVFQEEQGIVAEVSVDNLKPGDRLLFFRSNEKTRDMVDDVIMKLIEEERLPQSIAEAYRKSKIWKEELRDFKNNNNYSTGDLISVCDFSLSEQTVRIWLDDDAHTVGPKDPQNLKKIGAAVQDADLENNYMDYFNACAVIRSTRKNLLNYIGKAIVMHLTNQSPKGDSIEEYIYDNVSSLGELLEIQSITKVSQEIPMNLINRPISLKE